MLYVILDPAHDYPTNMVEFLGRYERKAIMVFTDEGQYHAFNYEYARSLERYVADMYLVSEFENLESLAEKIKQDYPEEIEGIIPWAEFTIELGARLGELLELDWNSCEVIHRFRNKYILKDYLRHHSEVRINPSRIVNSDEEALEFQETVDAWPIVVKPMAGAGSRNVFFCENREQLVSACNLVAQWEGEVLLEAYIGGQEFVVNGITDAEHNVLITDAWRYDKRDSHGKKNLYYETIKLNRYEEQFAPLAVYAGEVIEALGLRKSPFHMEIKFDENGPCLIEVGARFAGGNQPLLASQLHCRSLFELAACHYVANLPLTIEDVHYDIYDSYQARIINGIQSQEIRCVRCVHGLEEVKSLASFFMMGWCHPIGAYVPVTQDLFTKSYEVYLLHSDPEQIEEDAASVRKLLHYQ